MRGFAISTIRPSALNLGSIQKTKKILIINRYFTLGDKPMKKTSNRLLSVLFSIIISTVVFGFAIPATSAEPIEQQGLVDQARVTFDNFMKDENQAWLKENLNQAKGLLIIPSLLKA